MANQVLGTRCGSLVEDGVRLMVLQLTGKVALALDDVDISPTRPVMLTWQSALLLAHELERQAETLREAHKAYDAAGVEPFKLAEDGWPEPLDAGVPGADAEAKGETQEGMTYADFYDFMAADRRRLDALHQLADLKAYPDVDLFGLLIKREASARRDDWRALWKATFAPLPELRARRILRDYARMRGARDGSL